MAFDFKNLDQITRDFMVDEIQTAINDENLYFSKRFNLAGEQEWSKLLLEAAREKNEHWLAYQIEARGLMKGMEMNRTRSGNYTIKHVPDNAAETIAEGQFNRYYILGVCQRAISENKSHVNVYRAKQVSSARSKSAQLVGTTYDPRDLIRQIQPVQSSLGHELLQPNSGLSVCI